MTWPVLAKLKKAPASQGDATSAAAHPLVERHFAMQDERPAPIAAVDVGALDPFLRSLVFTDGTVTRALGVRTLGPVAVEKVGQAPVPLGAEDAACLEAETGEESVRRRVRIAAGPAAAPLLWAESQILPERLPPGFMGLLDGAPDGIGQSLQRVALESYRELLWFGLSTAPEWVPAAEAAEAVVERRYRVVSGGRAAILIAESFAVERRAGTYFLAGLDARGGDAPGAAEVLL